MSFETISALIALVATIPVYKGWVVLLIDMSRARKVKTLERQLTLYTELKEDFQHFVWWLGQGILYVLAFLAIALMFAVVASEKDGQALASVMISISASIAYLIAAYRLGIMSRLSNYDKTIRELEQQLSMLRTTDSAE